jgi:hypothetical protein
LLDKVANTSGFKDFVKGIRFGRAKLISIISSGVLPEYLRSEKEGIA